MKKHEISHTNEKPFQCDICESHFASLIELKLHDKVHGEIGFQCVTCPKSFATIQHLKAHEALHYIHTYI